MYDLLTTFTYQYQYACAAPKLDPSLFALLEEDIGCFEGNTFFLMSTSFLESRNHAEPPSITTFDPVASTTDDARMKAQLRQAWEQGFAKALDATHSSKPFSPILADDDLSGLGFWSQSNAFVA